MKTKIILSVSLLLGIIVTLISMNKYPQAKGPHGGKLQQAGEFIIEMKAVHPEFYAFLLNRQCKPINNKGISCEIRFLFPDNTNLDVTLKPYEEDGFKTESGIEGYHSYRVNFYAFGKHLSAKFENENIIVRNKR